MTDRLPPEVGEALAFMFESADYFSPKGDTPDDAKLRQADDTLRAHLITQAEEIKRLRDIIDSAHHQSTLALQAEIGRLRGMVDVLARTCDKAEAAPSGRCWWDFTEEDVADVKRWAALKAVKEAVRDE